VRAWEKYILVETPMRRRREGGEAIVLVLVTLAKIGWIWKSTKKVFMRQYLLPSNTETENCQLLS
jgi:hypothetical protein